MSLLFLFSDYTAGPPALNVPQMTEKGVQEPPSTPSPTTTDVQSSKKWKRILKLGKT